MCRVLLASGEEGEPMEAYSVVSGGQVNKGPLSPRPTSGEPSAAQRALREGRVVLVKPEAHGR